MSEVVFFRFQPDAMDRETLERLFTGKKRKELLMRLTREIKTAVKNRTPRYYLIVGPRGVGKTHFLTLLYFNVKEQIENALAVKLSEEEFSVYRVSDLLLRILKLSKGEETDLSDIERMKDDEVVVAALDKLRNTNKMIVLFLENLNQLLGEQMENPEVQKLRSVFQTENLFTVVTTAPLVFKQVSDHEEPFFNFFEYLHLDELTRAELKRLVREIATIENDQKFLSKMDEYAQKIDAVYILTGGSPRMAMLLYDLMSKGNLVDVEKAFSKLLDENTPYYQDVFRLLSGEKRKIFDTLIELGKPSTPKTIAEKARLENNIVNTLLRRLEKDGYVRSRRLGKTTKYEVRERLFRLWRELRREPFAKQKLSILVEFLELWYSPEERKEKFLERFKGLRETLDEKREIEVCYWFLSLPKEYKKELIPQLIEEIYEIGEAKLLDELVYIDTELKPEAIEAEFKILAKRGKYEELLEKSEKLINDEVNNVFAWLSKGTALLCLYKFNEALEVFSHCIEVDPEEVICWASKGMVLFVLDKKEEALDLLSKSIELNPEISEIWLMKGIALDGLERYEEALEATLKSLELNHANAITWHLKGSALGRLGRYEEALEATSKSLELGPENAAAWLFKGRTLGRLGRYEEALEATSKSLELDSENATAWALKGWELTGLGRHEEALEATSKSLELDPENAAAWGTKGAALTSLGRHEEALEACSKALELDSTNAGAWVFKGLAHLNMTTQEFEKTNYGNALENLNAAIMALDQFSNLLKDTEKAKEVIKGAIMGSLKELIESKNIDAVEMALNAVVEKKEEEFKELFEPIAVAVEIVKSKDLNRYYDLQAERREVVVDIVKKLTGSDELVPEEYRRE